MVETDRQWWWKFFMGGGKLEGEGRGKEKGWRFREVGRAEGLF
jgi:hypothetical protein